MSERTAGLQSIDDDERARRDADPAYLSPDYVGTRLRAPSKPLVLAPQTLTEVTGPLFGRDEVPPGRQRSHTQARRRSLGERIFVKGRVLDERWPPRPQHAYRDLAGQRRRTLSAPVDHHDAPLDPNFTGSGRAFTDVAGHYRFNTIKPGAYPWRNHANAWRPAHIHFSLFGPDSPSDWSLRCTSLATRCFRSIRSTIPCPIPRRASAWSASSTSK